MAFIVKVERQVANIEAGGPYLVKVMGFAKMTNRYGESIKITFKIIKGPNAGKQVTGICPLQVIPGRKTARWLAAMGAPASILERPDAKFDIQKLVGKVCRIMVDEKEGQNGTFSVVEKVLPLKREAEAQPEETGESQEAEGSEEETEEVSEESEGEAEEGSDESAEDASGDDEGGSGESEEGESGTESDEGETEESGESEEGEADESSEGDESVESEDDGSSGEEEEAPPPPPKKPAPKAAPAPVAKGKPVAKPAPKPVAKPVVSAGKPKQKLAW